MGFKTVKNGNHPVQRCSKHVLCIKTYRVHLAAFSKERLPIWKDSGKTFEFLKGRIVTQTGSFSISMISQGDHYELKTLSKMCLKSIRNFTFVLLSSYKTSL